MISPFSGMGGTLHEKVFFEQAVLDQNLSQRLLELHTEPSDNILGIKSCYLAPLKAVILTDIWKFILNLLAAQPERGRGGLQH